MGFLQFEKGLAWLIFFPRACKFNRSGVCISEEDVVCGDYTLRGIMKNCNEESEGNRLLFLQAGLACLASWAAIYFVTRPVIWLDHLPGIAWLLMALFTVLPLMVVFFILYCSAWHREFSTVRRIVSLAVSSCIVLGADLLILGTLGVVGCLVIGLARRMGGN